MKKRTQRILTRLFAVNSFLTCEELSKEFSISERTLRNELVLINQFLSENQFSTIATTRGKGLKLDLSDEDREKLLSKISNFRETDYYQPNERFLALLLDIVDTTKTT